MDDAKLIALIYELKGEFTGVKNDVASLILNAQELTETVGKFPCVVHTEKLVALEDWKKTCNGIKQAQAVEIVKGKMAMRQELIKTVGALIGSAIGGGAIVALFNYLATGKP